MIKLIIDSNLFVSVFFYIIQVSAATTIFPPCHTKFLNVENIIYFILLLQNKQLILPVIFFNIKLIRKKLLINQSLLK